MQIDSALSSTPVAARASANSPPAADDAVTQTATSATSSQDEAVHISAEGAAAAAQDGEAVQDDGESAAAAADSTPASGASAVQSFAYGTLGLERPDQPHEERNAFYTAGRWLAAAITIGGIISLLA
jgi:hypothetical protein